MKQKIGKWMTMLCGLLLAGGSFTSCSMMHQDLDDCPTGLYLTFRYDYNLERADMFSDHVGAVTVYVFDEQGRYLSSHTEANSAGYLPLKSPVYTMHLSLPEGKYKFLALAGQKSYEEMMAEAGAKFVRHEPEYGGAMEDLSVTLDHEPAGEGIFEVKHQGQPLDTLWHGMQPEPVEVFEQKPTYDTISLVRDTKQIHVALRDLDVPEETDINDYELKIIDRNARILWNNDVDETDRVVYTPYATWNTDDRVPATKVQEGATDAIGHIAHADFMTSRILWHENPADDAVLYITHKESGREVVRMNLASMLARMRLSQEMIYSPQEFLDRGYDYRMTFYLKGGTWAYLEMEIDVLSWSMRVENVEL